MTSTAIRLHRIETEVAGVKVAAHARTWRERNPEKATRIYGAVDAFAAEQLAAEPYSGEHLYDEKIQPAMWAALGEDGQAEMTAKLKEYRAWKRQTIKVARQGLTDLLTELAQTEGWDIRDTKLTFSVHAGCSCPCSPGFILAPGAYNTALGYLPVDLFIG